MERTETTGWEEVDPGRLTDLPLLQVIELARVGERLLETALAGREVSLLELRFLSVCAARPGITAVEASRALKAEPPTVSRVVQPLVQRELLSRRRSQADRRTVRLRATAGGLALLEECLPLIWQVAARFLGHLAEDEERSFRRSVETLLAAPGDENAR